MAPRSDDLYSLPPGIPVPVDDGACAHLAGMRVPFVSLRSTGRATGTSLPSFATTRGSSPNDPNELRAADRYQALDVDLAALPDTTVIYAYPRTGHPDKDPPPGWDAIPGARGCTPQSCAFRDLHAEIRGLGAEVYGLSTQTTDYQQEVKDRLHLPFELLSDAELALTRAMRLPTFTIESMILLKRFTLVVRGGSVAKVFYPVFPPDRNASDVRDWLAKSR
jgi:peroxiredoxin